MVASHSRIQRRKVPRYKRLHIENGFYYIVMSSNPQLHIFSHPNDFGDFERFLSNALESCQVRIHAFAWQRDSAHLVVQIAETPVGRFVQRLACQYARKVHRQRGGAGHLFQQRHHALYIDPNIYLLRLIRFVHWLSEVDSTLDGIDRNRLSSHSAYLGITHVPWLTISVALSMLARISPRPEEAYVAFMEVPPDPLDQKLFPDRSRRTLPPKPYVPPPPPDKPEHPYTLDQIIDAMSLWQGVERKAVMSKSRQRYLTMVRALISYAAVEVTHIASLANVARKLKRDPATLHVGLKRYRELRPDLFNKEIVLAKLKELVK
jgi:hypothetical protein